MVLHNNFKCHFRSANKNDNSTHWRCVTRTCDAKLYTDKNNELTLVVGEHNHHHDYEKSNNNRLYQIWAKGVPPVFGRTRDPSVIDITLSH